MSEHVVSLVRNTVDDELDSHLYHFRCCRLSEEEVEWGGRQRPYLDCNGPKAAT